ncbi:hypothetical protein BGZ58_006446 [Dissophora ornata]|nr:hypothetical protein BGZ58_006446 [Dissophora ornata]
MAKYKEFNALKVKKPSLRTALTVGGWDMKMEHYSEMVSTHEKREKFIKSAIAYVREHDFDGLDFDWEYPADKKRGGHDADPENFVAFLKEMREAADAEVLKDKQERLILSIALPGGPFHGDYFLIPQLAAYADWFNIMAYNLHGPWESVVFCAAPLNDPANATEYNGYSLVDAINSMAPKTVDTRKFNLGLSLSGVTFTLQDKQKTSPGSPAAGPGREGCQEKGAMAYFEARKLVQKVGVQGVTKDGKSMSVQSVHIQGGDGKRGRIGGGDGMSHHIMAGEKGKQRNVPERNGITQMPQMDGISKCMYMVVDEDQWVGFDTPETFAYKVDYLKSYGFGGVSIWSMDSDTNGHELTNSIHSSLTKDFIQDPTSNKNLIPTSSTSSSLAAATQQTTQQTKAPKADNTNENKKSDSGAKLIQGFAPLLLLIIFGSAILA